MKANVSLDEQETLISLQPQSISKNAEVYSTIPSTIQRLRKLQADNPDDVTLVEDEVSARATIPRGWVKISRPRRMSDEQKAINAARLAAAREARKHDGG